jgi:hypothetical protein
MATRMKVGDHLGRLIGHEKKKQAKEKDKESS